LKPKKGVGILEGGKNNTEGKIDKGHCWVNHVGIAVRVENGVQKGGGGGGRPKKWAFWQALKTCKQKPVHCMAAMEREQEKNVSFVT